ncbi:Protein of uncharacterised function (DUF2591) [Serratia ficaria]|uniref:DUF2591 domain-containing protein n=1 Tax=Serratia ficaria TaxID=61651 RepID=UPI00217A543C|nr:DUF2591 domain-containing protein [Serratia ficaria]CAI1230293.1 Protein of uncharacterised function (DUF2591) [Serratia ficaria]CAI1769833.1 Protein of uncharacterised function (DUF2591) [Serratia ficaria]CAI2464836.1 Protein of uncharacterised function (DUF2591) [Serratia ficaria]
MIDYSKMSDRAINALVGMALGKKVGEPVNGIQLIEVDGEKISSSFDPCNNPGDAWPIILANRISLMFDKSTEEGNEAKWCLASSPCDQYIVDYVSEQKLLRAAMIVFLMMKESEQCSS